MIINIFSGAIVTLYTFCTRIYTDYCKLIIIYYFYFSDVRMWTYHFMKWHLYPFIFNKLFLFLEGKAVSM